MEFLNKYVNNNIMDIICENNDENIICSIIVNKDLVCNNIELLLQKGMKKIDDLLIYYLDKFLIDTNIINDKLTEDRIKLINEDIINIENL